MPQRWFAISSKIKTKAKFLAEIKKSPSKSKLKLIKNVIIFDFETENLDSRDDYGLGSEGSILQGYVLIQINDKHVKDVIKAVESHKIGRFIMSNPKEMPHPIPKREVERFKSGVKKKKDSFAIGDAVKITDGILKGFSGVIVKKKKLMAGVEVRLPNSVVHRDIALISLEKVR